MTVKEFLIKKKVLHLFRNCVVDQHIRENGQYANVPSCLGNMEHTLTNNPDAINRLLIWDNSCHILYGGRGFRDVTRANDFWSNLYRKHNTR
jgi:hypothetical protein